MSDDLWTPPTGEDSMFASDPLGLPPGLLLSTSPPMPTLPTASTAAVDTETAVAHEAAVATASAAAAVVKAEVKPKKKGLQMDDFPALTAPTQTRPKFVPKYAKFGRKKKSKQTKEAAASDAMEVVEVGFERLDQEDKEAKPLFVAKVHSVRSGDTVILRGLKGAEKVLGIDGVDTPRFRRGRDHTQDEAYAFEAREYLRKLLISKRVYFRVTYTAPSGRQVGKLVLPGVGDVATQVIASGLGVPRGTPKNHPELFEAQEAAQAQKKGRWQETPLEHGPQIKQRFDERAFFNQHKNQVLRGIVDTVRDGSTLRVEILTTPQVHHVIDLHLAGVESPPMPLPLPVLQAQWLRKKDQGQQVGAKPTHTEKPVAFAQEACEAAEQRVLQRDVRVTLLSVDKLGNFFGTLSTEDGADLGKHLVAAGLAKTVAWSAELLSAANKQALETAEAAAELAGQGLHAAGVASGSVSGSVSAQSGVGDNKQVSRQFDATVTQVLSGDSIVVSDSSGTEHAIRLASVRAPTLGSKYARRASEPFARRARDFVRRLLVGKNVSVTVEYIRASQMRDKPDLVYATVTTADEASGDLLSHPNVAVALVARGLAEPIRHRAREARSMAYELLLDAEQEALVQKRGMHDEKELASEKKAAEPLDLMKRGKGNVPEAANTTFLRLQRARKPVPAVVEYVFSGSRFKVFVPSANATLSFVLSAVHTAYANTNKEPRTKEERIELESGIGASTANSVRRRILHRDVLLEFDDLNNGNFMGTLLYAEDGDVKKKNARDLANLSIVLLEQGLARLATHQHAKKAKHFAQMHSALDRAQRNAKGLWAIPEFDPFAEEKAAKKKAETDAKMEQRRAQLVGASMCLGVTECINSVEFYAQVAEDPRLNFVEHCIAEEGNKGAFQSEENVRKGSTVLALFEGEWCRATVQRRSRNKQSGEWAYHVFFLDYGNSSELKFDQLLPMPAQLRQIPGLARRFVLAGLRAPGERLGYTEQARFTLADFILDKRVQATVKYVDTDGTFHVLVEASLEDGDKVDVSTEVVRQGYACLGNVRPEWARQAWLAALTEEERQAEQDCVGVWYNGDWRDESDD